MLHEMGNIASECFKHPNRLSIWSPAEGRFVCPESLASKEPAAVLSMSAAPAARETAVPGISPAFKLVFLTAALGTAFFTILCVALHLITNGQPPALMDKLITGMFDLVKVGFGAIVGLLGGKALDHRAAA